MFLTAQLYNLNVAGKVQRYVSNVGSVRQGITHKLNVAHKVQRYASNVRFVRQSTTHNLNVGHRAQRYGKRMFRSFVACAACLPR